MKKRSKAPARVAAFLALIGAAAAIVLVVAATTGDDDGHSKRNHAAKHEKDGQKGGKPKKPAPKVYTVQEGDTLSAIAHKTGVPLAQIERLNPDLDPQILIAGQELKLR